VIQVSSDTVLSLNFLTAESDQLNRIDCASEAFTKLKIRDFVFAVLFIDYNTLQKTGENLKENL